LRHLVSFGMSKRWSVKTSSGISTTPPHQTLPFQIPFFRQHKINLPNVQAYGLCSVPDSICKSLIQILKLPTSKARRLSLENGHRPNPFPTCFTCVGLHGSLAYFIISDTNRAKAMDDDIVFVPEPLTLNKQDELTLLATQLVYDEALATKIRSR
jgi:hypothetical protein